MKYNPFIFSFLIFIVLCGSINATDNYIINNNSVYINDSKVYLSATPHTLSSSGWVYFNLTSKVYTGDIDVVWGFNTTISKPTKAELYKPYWINTTVDDQKTFYNLTFIIYTGDELDYGNSYNTNYRYTITESIVNKNETTYITSNAAFDSYTTDGTNYTIYWYTKHDNYYLWKDFSSSFNSVIHDYKGYNKWYYIKNVPIMYNKEYTVRAWIDIPISTEKQSGKYYFAIKPSYETIAQAISNGHFYNLDPWWNATWTYRKEIILTGHTSGAQTDYQILLNITYDSDMQSDFDDLRFTNETHKLDSWLESKVDGNYALVWVEFPTTPANTVEQTYYMYYGNAGAASYWDIGATFVFGDDTESGDTRSGAPIWATTDNKAATDQKRSGTYSAKCTAGYGAAGAFQTKALSLAVNGSYAIGYYVRIDGTNQYLNPYTSDDIFDGTWDDVAVQLDYDTSPSNIYYYYLSWLDTELDISTNTWEKFEIIHYATNWKIRKNDGAWSSLFNYRNNPSQLNRFGHSSYLSTSNTWYDDIYVRKYAANPPTYAFGSEETALYIPPSPINLANTTDNFWVNHVWSVGSGNVTNSYNVSVNGVWHNTSPAYYNDTYSAHAWQNITVWAYNSTGTGTLSSGSISQDTQIPNNLITITNTSDWTGNASEVVYVDYDATDVDSDTATFSCNRIDLFTDFDTSTGKGNWTATANIYYVDFGVSDGYGSISNYTMTLRELSVKNGLIDELKLIMSEITLGLKGINMGNYLVYAFILIGVLLIILLIRILNNCIYGE